MSQNKELRINQQEDSKRSMYLAKELLLNEDTIDIVSGTSGAPIATRTAETLVRLGYVKYSAIKTETNIVNDNRRTRLVLSLTKTANFKKLYDENAQKREELIKERETNNKDNNNNNYNKDDNRDKKRETNNNSNNNNNNNSNSTGFNKGSNSNVNVRGGLDNKQNKQ